MEEGRRSGSSDGVETLAPASEPRGGVSLLAENDGRRRGAGAVIRRRLWSWVSAYGLAACVGYFA